MKRMTRRHGDSWKQGGCLLLLVLISTFAGSAHGFGSDSATPAPTRIAPELQSLIRFLDEQARSSGGLARRLADHEGFRDFLASQTGSEVTEETIARYFESSFRRLADPAMLWARQSEALRTALWYHGWTEPGQTDGYRCLAERSAANRDGFLERPRTPASPDAASAIEEAVATIRPVFIHNTNLLERIPEIPLVSSKEIRRTAGVGGLNTFFFNRGFLHSDDNLFFFLDLATAAPMLPLMQSIYGKYQFVPEDAFADERGWISAFVMYPYDLLRFATFACPDHVPALVEVLREEYAAELGSAPLSIAEINQRLRDVRRDAPRSVRVLRRGFPLWNEVRKNLYRLDFTVGDFTIVVRDAFRRWLSELSVSDPAAFHETLESIRRKGPGASQLDAFKNAFDLDLYFEFKVPVALPSDRMRQLGGSEG